MDEEQKKELFARAKEQEKTRHIHIPYEEARGRLPDFEVEYELDPDPELEMVIPYQGMRTDFLYEDDDPKLEGINMIWPELLNEAGEIIKNKKEPIKVKGRATMWICFDESRPKHQEKLKVGTKGYWVIGSKKLARVIVTQIIGLNENKAKR